MPALCPPEFLKVFVPLISAISHARQPAPGPWHLLCATCAERQGEGHVAQAYAYNRWREAEFRRCVPNPYFNPAPENTGIMGQWVPRFFCARLAPSIECCPLRQIARFV